ACARPRLIRGQGGRTRQRPTGAYIYVQPAFRILGSGLTKVKGRVGRCGHGQALLVAEARMDGIVMRAVAWLVVAFAAVGMSACAIDQG
ncbi:hypothetical protein C1X73_36350, partial [Pseudomonas sp. FW305-130]